MSENVAKLTAKQAQAIDALMRGDSVLDAAKTIGVNPRTVHRWLNDATFAAALDEAKRAAVRHATRKLAGALDQATTSVIHLSQLAEDEGVRLRAAVAVADMLHDLAEHGDFDERLAALEANAKP
jgi:transposase